jgi:hypothetical protein
MGSRGRQAAKKQGDPKPLDDKAISKILGRNPKAASKLPKESDATPTPSTSNLATKKQSSASKPGKPSQQQKPQQQKPSEPVSLAGTKRKQPPATEEPINKKKNQNDQVKQVSGKTAAVVKKGNGAVSAQPIGKKQVNGKDQTSKGKKGGKSLPIA